jgi:hypothetical protein
MQITSGRVVYSRTVQPAQFESKRAEVELSFVLSEKEELGDALISVGKLAQRQALEMVGLNMPAPPRQSAYDAMKDDDRGDRRR